MQAIKGENMPALVPELVDMASTPAVSTADLLRRALVVARRLAVPELVDWINSELNGYKGEVPAYRIIYGQLVAYNDVRGEHIPCTVGDDRTSEALRRHTERQSVSVLEGLIDGSQTQLIRSFSASVEKQLMESMSFVRMIPRLILTKPQVQGILDCVRNGILEWALDLEGRGVLGEGMTFTPQEKQTVQEQHYHFGNVSGSQIQISSNGSTQTQANTTGTDLEALRGLVEALGTVLDRDTVQGDAADELRAELATLKAQAASPKPKWDTIKATARTIKTVAEGAAGNILGELAKPHVTTLLALAAGG
jgi:AbiTii